MTGRYIASKVLYALALICFLLGVFSVAVGSLPVVVVGWAFLAAGLLVA
jgi:hypothetical protein